MSSRNKTQSNLDAVAATRIKLYKHEIKEAGKDLMVSGMKLRSPHERVKMCQWLKKLSEYSTEGIEGAQNVHSYMQYLRASLQGDYQVLTKPFNTQPTERLVSFGECIANKVADAVPDIPRVGRLQPVLMHKSADNRAFMCVKRTADQGLICYMAVASDANAMRPPSNNTSLPKAE